MSVGGEFWMADNPGHRVRGEFTAEIGEKPEAPLSANLVDDPRVAFHKNPAGKVTGFAVSAQPVRSVASFLPITLHGQLDTGELVTLLEAQNYGGPGRFAPRYRAPAAILGGHVTDNQLYNAIRFRWTIHTG